MSTTPLLEFLQVSRGVRTADGAERALISEASFRIAEGEMVHLIGASGSGKTSLLRLINRLDEPTAGEIRLDGQSSRDWDVFALRRQAGLVFQEPSLLGQTVEENLRLPWRLAGENPPPRERLIEILRLVHLEAEFLERDEESLSGGEKHRVAIARALGRMPRLLLLDEPTRGLDAETAADLLDTLHELQANHRLTLLMATHRREEVRRSGGRVIALRNGRIVADGEAVQVLARLESDGGSEEGPSPGGEATHA